jgi:type I restriction enzyme, S subunit
MSAASDNLLAPCISDVPGHWQKKRLKFVAPSARQILPARPEGSRYVGLENIESATGRMLLESEQTEVESSVAAFSDRSVLFGKLRPYLAKVAVPDFSGVASTEIMVFEPGPENERRFLFYLLLSDSLSPPAGS